MLRSFLSVIAGYIVMAALVVAAEVALATAFPEYRAAGESQTTPPPLPVAVHLACAALAAATGGFATARIAAKSTFRHALTLAGLLMMFGAVYAAVAWNGAQPNWYLVLLPPLGAMGAIAGGWLGARDTATTKNPAIESGKSTKLATRTERSGWRT